MSKTSIRGKALITGHRGMGVLEKPRNKLLDGAMFYPENSVVAFQQAIAEGADALECDIHVTKEGQAMVIHGSKAYQYADYIGTNSGFHLGSDDSLAVERFTQDELQQSFSLKSYRSEFDTFDKFEKADVISDEGKRAEVVAEKIGLLADEPEFHRIPTLEDLLTLGLEENIHRQEIGKPPLKINIELKGRGSAAASLGAISQFYKNNPQATEVMPPQELVFLGRREVGEITIANAILKGNPDLGMSELRDQFAEDYLANPENVEDLTCQFERTQQLKENIDTVFGDVVGPLPEGLGGMEHQVLIKSYRDVGGNTDDLLDMLQDKFMERLETQGIQDQFLTAVQENSGMEKGALKKYFKEAGRDLGQLTGAIGKQRAKPNDFKDALDGAIEGAWRRQQVGRNVNDQLNQQIKRGGEPISISDYASGLGDSLGGAQTNLMVTTGQLFSNAALANQEDFDTHPNITEISDNGRKRVYEAYTRYGYNGVDVSLYDFTPGLIETIQQGIEDSRFIELEQSVLGVTASNWKGTARENSLTDPCFAVTRAETIAERCGVPLLLKVDEPGMFKSLLEQSRNLDRSQFTFGPETVIATTTVELTPLMDLSANYHLDGELLGTLLMQREQDIRKVSSKPPRAMIKQQELVTKPMMDEVADIRAALLRDGATLDQSSESVGHTSEGHAERIRNTSQTPGDSNLSV